MDKVKYLVWLLGIILWNYSVPGAKPIYDVGMAILLKHMFDFSRIPQQSSYCSYKILVIIRKNSLNNKIIQVFQLVVSLKNLII